MLAGKAESTTEKLKVAIEHHLSNLSEELSHSYVQTWLADKDARESLKRAVLSAFDGKDGSEDETKAASRLREMGMDVRKDAKALVDEVLELLARSLDSHLSLSDHLILKTINDRSEETLTALHGVEGNQEAALAGLNELATKVDAISSSSVSRAAVDDYLARHLGRARKRRWFGEVDTVAEMEGLATRCDGGDLSAGKFTLRASAFRELAAALARKSQIAEATKWLSKAKSLDPTFDLRVDLSRIAICDGRPDDALRSLRDIQTPEARGLLLDAIGKKQGTQERIAYFNSNIRDSRKLTGAGLLSLATGAFEAGRYEEAHQYLSSASTEHIESCPAILSVRMFLRIALCRPQADRRASFQTTALHPKSIRLSEEPEKLILRSEALKDAEAF